MRANNSTAKPYLFYIKRISGLLLLLFLAAVFFFSAYSKIYKQEALDAFQWSFLDIGISNNFLSAVLARLMIGVEFLLGIQVMNLKNQTAIYLVSRLEKQVVL